jgi:Fe-S-cluster containining protein
MPAYDWARFAPVKRNSMVFPLPQGEEFALYEIVKNLPVEWHSTTPRKFKCQKGCFKCCTMCWFNKDEISKLPPKYLSGLMPDFKHVQTVNGKCVFYDEKSALSCTIHKHSSLRCKIYPFEPILDTDRNSIVILAHDIMIWGGAPVQEPASLCYGLGNGKDVTKTAMKQCREYLLHSILEKSFSRFLWMGKAENFIDKRALYRRQNPLYKTFAQSHAARIRAAQNFSAQRFSMLMKTGMV